MSSTQEMLVNWLLDAGHDYDDILEAIRVAKDDGEVLDILEARRKEREAQMKSLEQSQNFPYQPKLEIQGPQKFPNYNQIPKPLDPIYIPESQSPSKVSFNPSSEAPKISIVQPNKDHISSPIQVPNTVPVIKNVQKTPSNVFVSPISSQMNFAEQSKKAIPQSISICKPEIKTFQVPKVDVTIIPIPKPIPKVLSGSPEFKNPQNKTDIFVSPLSPGGLNLNPCDENKPKGLENNKAFIGNQSSGKNPGKPWVPNSSLESSKALFTNMPPPILKGQSGCFMPPFGQSSDLKNSSGGDLHKQEKSDVKSQEIQSGGQRKDEGNSNKASEEVKKTGFDEDVVEVYNEPIVFSDLKASNFFATQQARPKVDPKAHNSVIPSIGKPLVIGNISKKIEEEPFIPDMSKSYMAGKDKLPNFNGISEGKPFIPPSNYNPKPISGSDNKSDKPNLPVSTGNLIMGKDFASEKVINPFDSTSKPMPISDNSAGSPFSPGPFVKPSIKSQVNPANPSNFISGNPFPFVHEPSLNAPKIVLGGTIPHSNLGSGQSSQPIAVSENAPGKPFVAVTSSNSPKLIPGAPILPGNPLPHSTLGSGLSPQPVLNSENMTGNPFPGPMMNFINKGPVPLPPNYLGNSQISNPSLATGKSVLPELSENPPIKPQENSHLPIKIVNPHTKQSVPISTNNTGKPFIVTDSLVNPLNKPQIPPLIPNANGGQFPQPIPTPNNNIVKPFIPNAHENSMLKHLNAPAFNSNNQGKSLSQSPPKIPINKNPSGPPPIKNPGKPFVPNSSLNKEDPKPIVVLPPSNIIPGKLIIPISGPVVSDNSDKDKPLDVSPSLINQPSYNATGSSISKPNQSDKNNMPTPIVQSFSSNSSSGKPFIPIPGVNSGASKPSLIVPKGPNLEKDMPEAQNAKLPGQGLPKSQGPQTSPPIINNQNPPMISIQNPNLGLQPKNLQTSPLNPQLGNPQSNPPKPSTFNAPLSNQQPISINLPAIPQSFSKCNYDKKELKNLLKSLDYPEDSINSVDIFNDLDEALINFSLPQGIISKTSNQYDPPKPSSQNQAFALPPNQPNIPPPYQSNIPPSFSNQSNFHQPPSINQAYTPPPPLAMQNFPQGHINQPPLSGNMNSFNDFESNLQNLMNMWNPQGGGIAKARAVVKLNPAEENDPVAPDAQTPYFIALNQRRVHIVPDMRMFEDFDHHEDFSLGPKGAKRLNAEIKLLNKTLPCDAGAALYFMFLESNLTKIKCLISGPIDTPYAHGLYLFDIALPSDYPLSPPQVQIRTTGNSSFRFNPNLYSNGKVCLSIINTWPGNPEEKWNPQHSNLFQVFMSIQSLVMENSIIQKEPNFEMLPVDGPENSLYQLEVKYGNVRFAMIEQIKNPPPGFEDIVELHFMLKKKEILSTVYKWTEESKKHIPHPEIKSQNPSFKQLLDCGAYKKFVSLYHELAEELDHPRFCK